MKDLHGTKVTLEEVAQAAGVSRATASRVLTSDPRVSPDARRAVERAASKLGYVPNQAGRALATGRSDAIALVVFEPTTLLFGDPFFPRLIRGLGDVLTSRDMQLILLAPQSAPDADRVERYVAAGHVDRAHHAQVDDGVAQLGIDHGAQTVAHLFDTPAAVDESLGARPRIHDTDSTCVRPNSLPKPPRAP